MNKGETQVMRVHSILAASVSLILATFAVGAQELTKEAKIERILALTSSDFRIDQVFNQIKAMTSSLVIAGATPEQRAKAQEVQGKILDLVKDRMSSNKLLPQYVKIYTETFSDDEINGILTFYESPAGRAMLERTPVLMSKVMAAVQAQMGDLMPEIQRITKEAQEK
jgi:uncharacterized protein